jgi:S1-C subfamily serine protease
LANDDGAGDDNLSNDSNTPNDGSDQGFPTDDWPELGVVTYAGEYGGSQGQVIMRVVPGSAAEKAGLVSGDVILTFNGTPVPSADDLDQAFNTANGKFEVSVWDARTGRKSTISGTLDQAGAAPANNETTAFAPVQQ